ncbi:MAG: thiolase family protein [Burkholderiales bacterium]|nr:thiolase family protein [Burkholderiales bacterium]OJX05217.1 MAG: thiolase [Burkholderiales bacterium 70-64]
MSTNKRKDIAIIGYGETPVVLRGGRSSYELAAQVMEQILVQTGIDKREIDGLAISETMSETGNPFWGVYMCEMLGLSPSWMQLNGLGGASSIGGIARAAAAIRDGMCETVLVLASDAQSSGKTPEQGAQRHEFMYPVGLKGPVGAFGLLSERYRHQYGLDERALAKLAVTQRNHALMNPNGCEKLRKPLTEEDYLSSKYVSTPIRVLDSVMVCDGANGVLVTSTENARRLGARKMIHPIGYGEISNFNGAARQPDITVSGFSLAGPKALRQAGMRPPDVRMIMPYDDFLIALIITLEDIGFCEKGKGAQFVLDTDLSYRGTLPLNTSGGQISAGQPGLAGGGLNLVEGVRQMFEEAGERQVSDPRNCMVTGIGVIPYGRNWGVSNVMILEQP